MCTPRYCRIPTYRPRSYRRGLADMHCSAAYRLVVRYSTPLLPMSMGTTSAPGTTDAPRAIKWFAASAGRAGRHHVEGDGHHVEVHLQDPVGGPVARVVAGGLDVLVDGGRAGGQCERVARAVAAVHDAPARLEVGCVGGCGACNNVTSGTRRHT